MENQLFRQKSLERISSPEEIRDYLRVTSPRLWMILGAVLILAVGFAAYASTAGMENTMTMTVEVVSFPHYDDNGQPGEETVRVVYGYIPLDQMGNIETGMTVRIGSETGKIGWVSASEESQSITVMVDMDNGDTELAEGKHEAVVVLEKTTPISFLWN